MIQNTRWWLLNLVVTKHLTTKLVVIPISVQSILIPRERFKLLDAICETPNMEGQETVAPIAAEPRLEDKKVEDDPVVEPVVSGLSAIGLEPATAVNPDVVPEVAQPRQAIPTQEINPKFLTWTTAKALILEYPTLEEYKKANERLIRDLENHDNEVYPKS